MIVGRSCPQREISVLGMRSNASSMIFDAEFAPQTGILRRKGERYRLTSPAPVPACETRAGNIRAVTLRGDCGTIAVEQMIELQRESMLSQRNFSEGASCWHLAATVLLRASGKVEVSRLSSQLAERR